MTVQIKYKNNLLNKNTANLVYFVDDKFNVSSLKKHILSNEFSFISDLMKTKDTSWTFFRPLNPPPMDSSFCQNGPP